MVTDSQNPLEHTCVISYSLFITKHDTLKEKKKKQPHFQKQKTKQRHLSASFLCAIRKYLGRCICESRAWKSGKPSSGSDLYSPAPVPFPHQLSSPKDKEVAYLTSFYRWHGCLRIGLLGPSHLE